MLMRALMGDEEKFLRKEVPTFVRERVSFLLASRRSNQASASIFAGLRIIRLFAIKDAERKAVSVEIISRKPARRDVRCTRKPFAAVQSMTNEEGGRIRRPLFCVEGLLRLHACGDRLWIPSLQGPSAAARQPNERVSTGRRAVNCRPAATLIAVAVANDPFVNMPFRVL
jgi:hypothetical protein